MGTNCALLVADLVLFWYMYESDLMLHFQIMTNLKLFKFSVLLL